MKNYRTSYKSLLAVVLAIFFMGAKTNAQNDLLSDLHKIQDSYKLAPYLSYDISYSVADVNKPDSSYYGGKGTFKISGSSYWGSMDSIEYMQNSKFAVSVFKIKKLVHISASSNVYPQLIELGAFDSLITNNKVKYKMSSAGKSKEIYFDFSDNPVFEYKNFRLVYDSETYGLKEISYEMSDLTQESIDEMRSSKVLIFKAIYTNYTNKEFDKGIFSAENYFDVIGTEYSAKGTYEGYEVFISSPELIKN